MNEITDYHGYSFNCTAAGAEVPAIAGPTEGPHQVLAAADPAPGPQSSHRPGPHRLCQCHEEGRPLCARSCHPRGTGA